MNVKFTKLSSKGQVVIPQDIREDLVEGTPFAVVREGDSIILKRVEMPKIKSWNEVAKPFREAVKNSGFTKEDLMKVITEVRVLKN